MSDLQEVIAANAVKAYNEGFGRGVVSERERIIELLEKQAGNITVEELHNRFGLYAAVGLIKGDNN